MSLIVEGTSGVIVPGGTEVTLKDALVLVQGGEVVCRVDAKYDFSDIPPEHHVTAVNLLLRSRVSLRMPSREDREQWDREHRAREQRDKAFAALPWWKKLFGKKPWEVEEGS